MIISKRYIVEFYSDVLCDTVVANCYLYSYDKTEGSFDFWEMSDVDYHGRVDIEWEVMELSRGDDMEDISVNELSDEDFEYIEQELIKYAEEYLEEEKASCY